MDTFSPTLEKAMTWENKIIVLAPPMPSLQFVSNRLLQKSVYLAVQDISPFPVGAYTGAVSAKNLEGFNVGYAIIGHSERRTYFYEDDAILAKKVEQALGNAILPIYCVQGKDTPVPDTVTLVAYEPVSAIGTGSPDTPENAEAVAKAIKEAYPGVQAVLYGGSVKPENVASFTSMESIDGVLVGGASLDAAMFIELIMKA